jgi:hypothetical protein
LTIFLKNKNICNLPIKDYITCNRILFFYFFVMKKVFWTTIFWLIIFALFVLYLKTFTDLGTKVSSWLSPTTITGQVTTGAQNDVMSGLLMLQTTLDDMNTKLDAISTKVGLPVAVEPSTTTGTTTTETTTTETTTTT